MNGAVNTKVKETPMGAFDDTVYGGDFLANQPPVKAMCEAAPSIIHLLDRMGVMFNRTPEGLLDFRRFGGTQHHRTAYAGRRPDSSSCTRWMSRFAASKLKGSFRNMKAGSFSEPFLMMTIRAGASSPKLNDDGNRVVPFGRSHHGDRGPGIIFGNRRTR
ncbi:FAD-binding protein [Bacillus licheniformis]|nr:FAD-binding protein [Bacillus licheniformis]